MYQVLARKWRPQVFEELVGQQTVTQTLQNAISSGRIAHAFLFSGPRGIGKTTCARILAKALNCQSSTAPVTRPCNICPSCVDIAASRSLDVLEIDGASNRGIDEVRDLRESAKYQPMRDRFRIFIIDEVHMLTTEAFNALLKILEEPPSHVFFIFATTEYHKVPATIVSRCQSFDFRAIPERILVQRLTEITREEKIEISESSLQLIAAASEGGLRDALGTLDQIIAFSGSKIEEKQVETILGLVNKDALIQLASAIAKGETGAVLEIVDSISQYGIDYKTFYNELLSFYRDLFLIRFAGDKKRGPEEAPDPRLVAIASEYEDVHLLRICHQLVSIQNLIRLGGNLRFLFEVTLVKLSQIKRMVPLEEIADTLKKNVNPFEALNAGRVPVSVPSASTLPSPIRKTAPSPSAAAAPPAGPSKPFNGSVSDDLIAMIIDDLEAQNPRLAAALEHSKLHRSDEKISFFVPEAYFRMVPLEGKDQTAVQNLLEQKLGGSLQVEILRGEPPMEKEVVRVATPETLVGNDPTVQTFLKTFKGRLGKIELNKER